MSDKERRRIDPIVLGQEDRVTQTQRPNAKAPRPERSSTQTGGGFWRFLIIVLILAVAALGGYGWVLASELNSDLKQLQTRFNKLENELTSQTGTLSETEAGFNKRLKDISATLEEHMSEIRKLWGVANDRNRKAIAKQEEDITKLKADVNFLSKKINDYNTTFAAFKQSISSSSLALTAEQDVMRQQLQESADALNSIQKNLSTLSNKLAKNDEAINSIDAYRKQVNQQLLRLERLIQQATPVQNTTP